MDSWSEVVSDGKCDSATCLRIVDRRTPCAASVAKVVRVRLNIEEEKGPRDGLKAGKVKH